MRGSLSRTFAPPRTWRGGEAWILAVRGLWVSYAGSHRHEGTGRVDQDLGAGSMRGEYFK